MDKPKGAQWYVFGAWHKVGEFDRVYIHSGLSWISSSKSLITILREVRKHHED